MGVVLPWTLIHNIIRAQITPVSASQAAGSKGSSRCFRVGGIFLSIIVLIMSPHALKVESKLRCRETSSPVTAPLPAGLFYSCCTFISNHAKSLPSCNAVPSAWTAVSPATRLWKHFLQEDLLDPQGPLFFLSACMTPEWRWNPRLVEHGSTPAHLHMREDRVCLLLTSEISPSV